jgi:DNA-binding NarL/FixJ family response regulator
MSNSISSSLATTPVNAANTSSNAAPAQRPQPAPKAAGDTVKLSDSQQVHQLYLQGQKVSQIAFSLNLSVDTVNNFLGISGSKS